MLTERQELILRKAVEGFLEAGQPVGSKLLSADLEITWGPSTVRHELAVYNFTSAEWQGRVTDQHIENIIVFGGQSVGKSAAMPPNPDLDGKPNVVKALRAHIRSLKK